MISSQAIYSQSSREHHLRGEVFTSLASRRLQAAWRQLEARHARTGFERFDYVKAVYEGFLSGGRAKPCIVVLYEAGSGQPVCIVPLVYSRLAGFKILETLDFFMIDFAAMPHDRDRLREPSYLRAVAAALKAAVPASDFFRCDTLQEGSTACHILQDAFGRQTCEVKDATYSVPLSEHGYASYVASNRAYKKMHQKLRRIESEFGIVMRPAVDPAEIDHVMDAKFRQRKARFTQFGRRDSVADKRRQAVFRQVAHALCPDRHALLLGAWADGECVATSFGTCCRNGLFSSQLSSFAEGPWAKHSLGLVSIALEIDWAQANGCAAYNLGAGEAEYKRRFGQTRVNRVSLQVALTAAGRLYHGLLRSRAFLARTAKRASCGPLAPVGTAKGG